MTGNQLFKHFDSAQCDIRVRSAFSLTNKFTINYNVMLSGVEAQNDKF